MTLAAVGPGRQRDERSRDSFCHLRLNGMGCSRPLSPGRAPAPTAKAAQSKAEKCGNVRHLAREPTAWSFYLLPCVCPEIVVASFTAAEVLPEKSILVTSCGPLIGALVERMACKKGAPGQVFETLAASALNYSPEPPAASR